MRFFAHIEVEFEADDDQDAFDKALEYAIAVEDLPDVIEAWSSNVEENGNLDSDGRTA